MPKIVLFSIFFSCLILNSSCVNIPPKTTFENSNVLDSAMVVSAHPLASEIGKSILLKGGNAVDAAIAVQFALAVVHPSAGNIGGGGFMVVRFNDGSHTSLDFRETAPALASKDMYLDEKGNVIDRLSLDGHLAVGVPGTVDGMYNAFKKYGTLKWEELLQPSIDLANNGFVLTKLEAEGLNYYNSHKLKFNSILPSYLEGPWSQGDTLKLTDLGNTLALIRDYQRAGFYEGETAEKFIQNLSH